MAVKITEISNETHSFEDWKKAVNYVFVQKMGMSPDDALGDWMSRDAYDDGLTVKETFFDLKERAEEEMKSFFNFFG